MPARGHADRADPLGLEAPFLRRGADEPHGPLAVLPAAPVARGALRPRRAVDEVHALEAEVRETLLPHLDEPHVAAALVAAAGDEDHAPAVRVRRRGEPLEVGHPVCRAPVGVRRRLIRHRADLVLLEIGNLPLRPQRHALAVPPRLRRGEKGHRRHPDGNKQQLLHSQAFKPSNFHPLFPSVSAQPTQPNHNVRVIIPYITSSRLMAKTLHNIFVRILTTGAPQ